MYDEQNNFYHARSCETQLWLTINDFAVNLNNILHGEVVGEVTHAKYLGVVIYSKLSWSQHISNKAEG